MPKSELELYRIVINIEETDGVVDTKNVSYTCTNMVSGEEMESPTLAELLRTLTVMARLEGV